MADDTQKPAVAAMPLEYHGITFRSHLEADWAAFLDSLEIAWSYEPMAVDLGQGVRHLCDFYLQARRTWLEVKGPHELRLHKTRALHRALNADSWNCHAPLIMVGRMAEMGRAVWHGVSPGQEIILGECQRCDRYSFIDHAGTWQCRVCSTMEPVGTYWASGHMPFVRAPRPGWVG